MNKYVKVAAIGLLVTQVVVTQGEAVISTFSSSSSSAQEMVNGQVIRKAENNESNQDEKLLKNGEIVDHRSANDSMAAAIDNIEGTRKKVSNSARSEKGKNKKSKRARMVAGDFALQSVKQQEAAQEGYISEQEPEHTIEAVMQSIDGDIMFLGSRNIWNYVTAQEAFEDAQELFRVDFSPETAFNVAHDIVQTARDAGCEESMNLLVIAAR